MEATISAANYPKISLQPTKPFYFSLRFPFSEKRRAIDVRLARFSASSNPAHGKTSQEASKFRSREASLKWSTRGLVLGQGPVDSWDRSEVGSPVVKRFLGDEGERWYMWYHGSNTLNPYSDSIGLAVSSNGIHWERGNEEVKSSEDAGMVMKCSEDWWAFDTGGIRPGEVMIMSSSKIRSSNAMYWLYYTGYISEKAESLDNSTGLNLQILERFGNSDHIGKRIQSLPGLAMSQDGRNWARIEGEHYSGALFDTGSENDWDFFSIGSPHVVFHADGDLRMYYHSFDRQNGEFCIGIARSRDGIKWVKLGKILAGRKGCFDEMGALNPCVVRNKRSNNYVMAYEGVDKDAKGRIGLAISEDGLKGWMKLEDSWVIGPGEAGAWDGEGVGSPCLVEMEDGWRLYYRGVGCGGRTGIGMAASEGSDIRTFRRCSGFQL